MTVTLADGSEYNPKDSDPVVCETHNFKTTWGELDPIRQLAVESSLDVEGDVCILDARK